MANLFLCALFMLAVNAISICNWASEASPTLGCSIEISRDIYMSVCLSCPKCVGGITFAHAQSQFWAVKSDR